MIVGISRILRNSTLSFVAEAAARASNTLLFILIARRLGAAEGGVYSLALTYALLFTQLSFWGLDQLLIRDVARNHESASHHTGSLILFRGFASSALYLLMIIWVYRLGYASRTATAVVVLGLTIITESLSNICQALFVAFEQVRYSTQVGLITGGIRLLGGTLVVVAGGQVDAVIVVLCFSSCLGLMLNLGIIYRHFPHPAWKIDLRYWFSRLTTIIPFILIGVFYIIEFQSDVLLLSVSKSEREVGIYNAATTVLFALALVPQAFRTAIFPVMSRLHAADSPNLPVVYEKSFKYLWIAALPIAAFLMLSADAVIRLLFGGGFQESGAVLRVVIWTFVLLMINVPSARMLVIANALVALAVFQGLSMVLNLSLNLLLIPPYGAVGAAWARIGSTSLFVLLTAVYTYWRIYRWNPFKVVVRPLLALIVMITLGWLLRGWNDLMAACVGFVIYAGCIWWLGVISKDERTILGRVLQRHSA